MQGQEVKPQKAVLISIQPKWCEKIAAGKKTVEVRKTMPKLETPFKCYIYCTNKKPFLVWGDVFRGNWETEITTVHGYSRKDADAKWGIFNGRILGEFVCDNIFEIVEDFNIHHELPGSPVEKWLTWDDAPDEYDSSEDIEKATCLSMDEISAYMGTSGGCFCWHISDLVIYDDPKPLSEFYKCGAVPMDDLEEELCCHCAETDYGEKKECHTPGGVWMCEGRWCAEAYQAYLDEEFALTRPPQSWCYVEAK